MPTPIVDAGLALVFIVAVTGERGHDPVDGALDSSVAGVLTLVIAASLALRCRIPLTAFGIGSLAVCAESLLHVSSVFSPYANQIGLYSLGLHATRARARWGPPIALAGVAVYFTGTAHPEPLLPVGVLFVWLATWALGYSTARRREEQDRARVAIRHRVIAEERTAMARELHDLIGHTVNLLVVQAGAARLVLDQDPAMTRKLLLAMEQIGNDALGDLDQVLGMLRSFPASPAPADLHPTPGLAQLPDLINRLTDAGIQVRLSLDPDLKLPRSLDLAAYRIVQEALTNALKHAAGCSATVVVHRNGDAVVIEISDDGPGLLDAHVPGRGLLGIAERVSRCGGTLEHGGGEQGGVTLRAVLPLRSSSEPAPSEPAPVEPPPSEPAPVET